MSTAAPDRPMTIAEFHALPEDESVRRELIRGVLQQDPMTRRNRGHSDAVARISQLLLNWVDQQPRPRGKVYGGEIGCDLPDVNTSVGIDVAYFDAETVDAQQEATPYLVGAPVLAVEVLSPSDTIERLQAKITDYLAAGTKIVWEVDPRFRTVRVYEPDTPPRMVSGDEQLSAESHLPGFAIPVRNVFER